MTAEEKRALLDGFSLQFELFQKVYKRDPIWVTFSEKDLEAALSEDEGPPASV